MSVPRMTKGVPSEICGVPAQNSLVIPASQHAYEDPRSGCSAERGPVRPKALRLETFRERAPHGRIEAQHWAAVPVLRVAHRDHAGRPAHLYAIALTARVGCDTPARDPSRRWTSAAGKRFSRRTSFEAEPFSISSRALI